MSCFLLHLFCSFVLCFFFFFLGFGNLNITPKHNFRFVFFFFCMHSRYDTPYTSLLFHCFLVFLHFLFTAWSGRRIW
jgi:hypothetical protein